MPRRPAVFQPPSVRGRQQTRRDHERTRASDPGRIARKRIYDSREWEQARAIKLASDPLCQDCREQELLVEAREVDHVIPLAQGGAPYDQANLRSLCTPCHSRKTARERTGGGGGKCFQP